MLWLVVLYFILVAMVEWAILKLARNGVLRFLLVVVTLAAMPVLCLVWSTSHKLADGGAASTSLAFFLLLAGLADQTVAWLGRAILRSRFS
jgi:hypothetical protein